MSFDMLKTIKKTLQISFSEDLGPVAVVVSKSFENRDELITYGCAAIYFYSHNRGTCFYLRRCVTIQ